MRFSPTSRSPHIDDAGLLRIAFVMEGKDRLDELISLVPEERLAGLLHTAERERLWPEALDLLDHLSAERRGALAGLAVSEDLLEAIVDAAGAEDLWPALLPIVAELPAPARDRVAELASTLEQPLLEQIVAAVNEHDLWSIFVPLAAEHMDAAGPERVAEIVVRKAHELGALDQLGPIGAALAAK
jgi:hypothetical protein